MLKVFLCGLPKSGTHTIHQALVATGFRSYRYHRGDKGERLARLLRRGHKETGDPLAYAPEAEAITDSLDSRDYWTCLDYPLLEAVRQHHPQALIVLNTRKPEDWVSSVDRWKNGFRQRIVDGDFPNLPPGVGARDDELIAFQQAHYETVRQMFAGDPYFIEFGIEEFHAPARLGSALGVELEWWGVANRNEKNPA